MINRSLITLDVDWAPDFAIEAVAKTLIDGRVKATWFVTHLSPAIENLRNFPELFELGIHPNFLPESTHGNTPRQVLEHLQAIVPEAVSVRTHSLVQSGPLLQMIIESNLKTDVSLFLPGMEYIQPFEFHLKGKNLFRIPYFWSDDYEMGQISPCWQLSPLKQVKGLKVMNFHPINIYLNVTNPEIYTDLKTSVPSLAELTASVGESFVEKGEGPGTMFKQVVDYLARAGDSFCICDIYTMRAKGYS
jgi:hypothetical protein